MVLSRFAGWLRLLVCLLRVWRVRRQSRPFRKRRSTRLVRKTDSQPVAAAVAPSAPAFPEARPEQALAKVPITPADPQWGSVDAPVTIVELSDFQCPFCARVLPTLEQLKQKYGPSQLRIVWKNNPLPFHENGAPGSRGCRRGVHVGRQPSLLHVSRPGFWRPTTAQPREFEKWASAAGVAPSVLAELAGFRPSRAEGRRRHCACQGHRSQRHARFSDQRRHRFGRAGRWRCSSRPSTNSWRRAPVDANRYAPRLVYVTLTDKNVTLAPPSAPSHPAAPDEEDTKVWNIPVAPDDPQRGAKDALVTLIEYSDFQCPFCKRVQDTLEELRKLYGKDLRIVWKDNPLPFHPRAMPAAKFARVVWQHAATTRSGSCTMRCSAIKPRSKTPTSRSSPRSRA